MEGNVDVDVAGVDDHDALALQDLVTLRRNLKFARFDSKRPTSTGHRSTPTLALPINDK